MGARESCKYEHFVLLMTLSVIEMMLFVTFSFSQEECVGRAKPAGRSAVPATIDFPAPGGIPPVSTFRHLSRDFDLFLNLFPGVGLGVIIISAPCLLYKCLPHTY